MPTGPGDEILDAIEAGTADNAVMKKYGIDADRLKAFKSLHYGLSNQKMAYDEIGDYYPELNKYFKLGPYLPKEQPAPANKPAQTVMEKPDFTKPVKQKQAVESTAAPVALKDFQHSAETGKAGETLQQKFDANAKQSLLTINKELAENDDVVTRMIKENRYNQAKEQDLTNYAGATRTDMPAAAMLSVERNRVMDPETKPQDIPVAPEEVAQRKAELQGDETQARMFINKIAVYKPEKAKEVQKSTYMLDAYERMKQTPDIGIKVNKNLHALENGELKYNASTQQLVRELGFVDAIVSGVKERTRQMHNYDLFQKPDDQLISILESRLANQDPDEPVDVPKGAAEVGQMLGMEWKTMLKGIGTSLVANAVGAGEASPYITAALSAPEYYKRGYSTTLEETYGLLRKQGKSPEEAIKLAKEQADQEGKLNAAEGAVGAIVGGRIGLRELPKFNITGGFKNAVKGVLAKSAHYAGETTIDGMVDGLVAGYMQERKDVLAAEKGLVRDTEKNIRDNVMGELTFSLAVAGMTKAGKAMVDPDSYKKIIYWMSRQPKESVDTQLGTMVMNGEITDEDAKEVQTNLAEQRKVDQTVPDDIKDVSRMAMIEKINRRNELTKELESVDEAMHPPIKEEIKKLNEEILEHSKYKKTTEDESETEAKTQAEAEGASVTPEAEPQQTSPVDEGAAALTVEAAAAPAGESEHNVSLKNLDERAKELGYAGIKQLNTEEQLNDSAPAEVKQLLKEYAEHNENVKSLTDENEISTLNEHNFGTWVKANDVQRDDLGRVVNESDLTLAAKRIRILEKRGLTKESEDELSKLKNSRRKDNWTAESWKSRFDEEISNEEIEAINKDNKSFNEKLDQVNVNPEPAASNPQTPTRGEESQGVVTQKAAKAPKATPKQQEFYDQNAGAAPAITGRVMPDPIVGGEPKELPKIIADVSKGLKQRLIYAKPGRGGAGAYLPGFKGIKIRNNNDLDVTAHELGHAIDDHFDLYTKIAQDPQALQELDQFASFGSTPPSGHPNPRKYIDKEGFAEWLRAFVVNPVEAERMAPRVTALYKASTSTKFQEAIKGFSDDVRTFAGANGGLMVMANIEFDPSNPKGLLGALFKKELTNNEFSVDWVDKIAANFTNPLQAFEKAFKYAKGIRGIDEVLPENDPIILSRILLGIDGKFGEILKSGMIDGRGKVLRVEGGTMLYDREGKLIKESGTIKNLQWLLEPFDNTDMATIKQDMKDTIAFMVAERTVELAGKFERADQITGIGGGIYSDFSVAQKALNEFYNGDPKRLSRIQEAAERYRSFADDILNYAVDKGRLSQEQYEAIADNNLYYVALNRILETEPDEVVTVFEGRGGALGSKSDFIHSIKGSTKSIENPYASLLDILYKTIRESDRNETLRAFRDMLVDPRYSNEGDPKRLSDIGMIAAEGDKETISIFVNGKLEPWRFQKDVHEQLKGLDKEAYRLPGIVGAPAKTLRFFTTHFPTFAVRNWIRDTQDRIIKSTTGSGFTDLIGSQEDWHAIARAGGLNSGFYFKSKDHYYGLLTEAMDIMAKDRKFILADPVMLKHMWGKYTDLLYKSETSNRVAEYRSAMREAKAKGMDDYNAAMYAAYKARNLIDFAIMGNWMKVANQIIPFSNAAVQGLRSAAYSMKENPMGFLAKTTMYSIIPGIAAWFWNHRNEEDEKLYEERPAYERDMFWGFRIGPNNWLSIPKPYELALPQAGIDRLLSYKYANNKKAFEGYTDDVLKLLLPFDEGNMAGPYQTVVEGMANYDFFRERNIIPVDEDPLNLALRHTETASRLGQLLQRFTQLEAIKYIPIVRNLSNIDARKWDHFLKRQFSYTGSFALKLSDIGKEDSRHKFDLTDTGLFKRSPAYNSVSVQDMIAYAKEFGLTKTPAYKSFNGMVGEYFSATDDEKQEEIGKQLIDYGKELLTDWKANNMDERKIEQAEAKKEAQKAKK